MPDFTAACMNRNNTGSLNRADLPGADLHLYTEPEVPFLHLYWPQEVFNHWAPVKSSVADITFSGLWFPFESLPLVTKEEHYRARLYLTGKKKKKTKQSAKYRVCLATMSEKVMFSEENRQVSWHSSHTSALQTSLSSIGTSSRCISSPTPEGTLSITKPAFWRRACNKMASSRIFLVN